MFFPTLWCLLCFIHSLLLTDAGIFFLYSPPYAEILGSSLVCTTLQGHWCRTERRMTSMSPGSQGRPAREAACPFGRQHLEGRNAVYGSKRKYWSWVNSSTTQWGIHSLSEKYFESPCSEICTINIKNKCDLIKMEKNGWKWILNMGIENVCIISEILSLRMKGGRAVLGS